MGGLLLLLALKGHRAGVAALLQRLLVGFEHVHQHLGVLVVAYGCYLLVFGELGLDGVEVFELQLGVDNLLVLHGIDGSTALAHHIVVVETADYMDDGVALTNVAQKLVAQSLALGGTLHQTGYIYNLAGGGHNAAGVYYLCQTGESVVGDGDYA